MQWSAGQGPSLFAESARRGTGGWAGAERRSVVLAGCGDIDIAGHRRPVSYYREIVFGLRTQPYVAVRRPQHHGQTPAGTPWAWSDSLSSWTCPGFEAAPVTVEVYGAADEVELLVNGRALGRRPTGEQHRFRSEFDTVHEPGELLAIAYQEGVETGRHLVRSAAGPVVLRAGADRPVSVEVSGEGTLLGFGSVDPSTEEGFDANERRTYEGRALAVLRPTGAGRIRLIATAPDCEPVELTVTVE